MMLIGKREYYVTPAGVYHCLAPVFVYNHSTLRGRKEDPNISLSKARRADIFVVIQQAKNIDEPRRGEIKHQYEDTSIVHLLHTEALPSQKENPPCSAAGFPWIRKVATSRV
jgi:hypothetical protein